jgi:hypothetical protein
MAVTDTERWPSIPVADWLDTRDTLQLYTQVVGRVRLANEPRLNHWWNVPLYVTARGLDFDVIGHRLEVLTVAGEVRAIDLSRLAPSPISTPQSCPCSLTCAEPTSGRCRWRSQTPSRSLTIAFTPATTPSRFSGSGSHSSTSNAS